MTAGYAGPLVLLRCLYNVAWGVGLLVLCWALGVVTLRVSGFLRDSPLDRALFGTAIGAGLLSTSILVLGWISLVQPWTLVGLLALTAGVAVVHRQTLYVEASRARRELAEHMGRPAVLVLVAVVAFLVLQSAMPPGDWDVLTYHLKIPAEFLARGRVFLPADNDHVAFVGLQHMLYIPLLAVHASSAPAVLSAGFAVLLGLTMFAAGRRLFDGSTGRLASVLLWGSPVILLIAVTARIDVTAAWFLLLANYAVVVCLERRELGGWFWVAALMAGFAIATKYSALAYVAGLAPIVAWVLVRGTSSPAQGIRSGLGFGGLLLLTSAPWLIKNMLLFGAPLYPFFTELHLEPWLARYVGSATVPPSVDPSVFRVAAETREPFSLLRLFSDPGSMTPEREGAFYFGNLAFLALPLTVLVPRRKAAALLVPPLVFVALLLYPNARTNLRYLIPALTTGTLVASWVLVQMGERLVRAGFLRRVYLAIISAVCLLPAAAAAYHKISEMRPYEVWSGLRAESEYLTQNADPDVYVNARVRQWVNGRLGRDDRVVMLFESRGYRFEPQVRQDNLNRNWAILASQAPWRDCLAPTGATHVLVNYGHLGSLVRRGLDPATLDWDLFALFARNCLVREGAVGSVVLYRIVR